MVSKATKCGWRQSWVAGLAFGVVAILPAGAAPLSTDALLATLKRCDPGKTDSASVAACTTVLSDKRLTAKDKAFIYLKRGIIYSNQSSNDLALKDFNSGLKLDPKNVGLYVYRGDSFYKSGSYEKAISDYQAAVKLDPQLAPIFGKIGLSYFKLGNLAASIENLTTSINLDPKNATTRLNRGYAFFQVSEFDKALEDYNAGVGLSPDNVDLRINRGDVYNVQRKYKEALEDYDKALELNPQAFGVYASRANIATGQGRMADASKDMERAFALGGERVGTSAYIAYGVILDEQDNTKRSIEIFQDAERMLSKEIGNDIDKIAKGKEYFLVYRALARAYIGNPDGSIADATKFLALSGNDPTALHARGLANAAKGEFPRALADYAQAIGLGEANFILRHRGDLYLAAGNPELAIADYEAMLKIFPSNAKALSGLEKARKAQSERLVAAGNSLKAPEAASAPDGPDRKAVPIAIGKRVALVIGNSHYAKVAALPNPQNDAARVAQALRDIGFSDIVTADDLSNQQFNVVLQNFAKKADEADWAIVYYAGHGIEIGNVNYLIPVDATLASDRDVNFETVPLDRVLQASQGAKALRLVIVDACRNNPFEANMTRKIATRAVTRGLARVEPEGGTLVVYAAKAGQVALDGNSGNSPFVTALVDNLRKPGIEISKLFRLVRDDVMKATNDQQEPFTYGSLPGRDYIFNVNQ